MSPSAPICRHARRGTVAAGDVATDQHASTTVCDRPECIEDALAWAQQITGLPATHRRDELPGQTSLFRGAR